MADTAIARPLRVKDGRLLAPTSRKLIVEAQCGRAVSDFQIVPRDAFTATEEGRPITGRALTLTTISSFKGGEDFVWHVEFDGRTAKGWLRYTSPRCESPKIPWSATKA
jgi:hypothetical protein